MLLVMLLLSSYSLTSQAADIHGQLINKTKFSTPKHIVVYLEAQQKIKKNNDSFTIHQKNRRFNQSFAVIPVGTKVYFSNDEKNINHNIFSRSPAGSIDFGLLEPGKSPSYTFNQTGRIKLLCSIHRHMRMNLYVTPSPWFAEIKEGRFTIRNVPAGTYRIRTWVNNGRFMGGSQILQITNKHIAWNVQLTRRGFR
jgi:plastocyanin